MRFNMHSLNIFTISSSLNHILIHVFKFMYSKQKNNEYCIIVKFLHSKFDLEIAYNKYPDCSDYIVIRDGINSWSDTLRTLCGGQDGWGEEIVSSRNGMRVEFVSNKLTSAQGFTASYRTSLLDDQGNQMHRGYVQGRTPDKLASCEDDFARLI